jgi:hypothetical protein
VTIGNPQGQPEIDLDEGIVVPLRELIAALNTVARVRNLLGQGDGPEARDVAQSLTGIGAPGGNDELPGMGKIGPAPTIVDVQTARDYLDALYGHLNERKPWGGLDPRHKVL